jgi:hypothetical protein
VSTTPPTSPTARPRTASAAAPASRPAIRVMVLGLALTVVALAAPVVDQVTTGTLAAHLETVYAGSGVAAPAAPAITIYLVVVGVVGVLCWVATIEAVRRRRRRAPATAAAFLVLGAALAVVDLTVSEYGRPILPAWLGVLGLLPCLAGLVAVVLLSRRPRPVGRS